MSTAALLLVLFTANADRLQPGDHTSTLTVDDRERTYLVHVPKSYDDTKPTSVVLAFHGGGSNAEQMMRLSGLNEKADEAGFIAVYPSGTGRLPRILTWNGGNCCGYAMRNTWPGRETPAKWLGKVTQDISANDLMWEFFQKHPMK